MALFSPFNAAVSLLDNCGVCGGSGSNSFSFPSTNLNHRGAGFSTTSIFFPSVLNNVEFSISGINNHLTGFAFNQYIEKILVYYNSPEGTTYFHSSIVNQSSAVIKFNRPLTSITLRLSDDQKINSGNSVMSVNLGSISGCFD